MYADIPSPCIGICRIDKDRQLCEGCLRTLDEIGCWGVMKPDEKLTVLHACLERRRMPDQQPQASGDNELDAS